MNSNWDVKSFNEVKLKLLQKRFEIIQPCLLFHYGTFFSPFTMSHSIYVYNQFLNIKYVNSYNVLIDSLIGTIFSNTPTSTPIHTHQKSQSFTLNPIWPSNQFLYPFLHLLAPNPKILQRKFGCGS